MRAMTTLYAVRGRGRGLTGGHEFGGGDPVVSGSRWRTGAWVMITAPGWHGQGRDEAATTVVWSREDKETECVCRAVAPGGELDAEVAMARRRWGAKTGEIERDGSGFIGVRRGGLGEGTNIEGGQGAGAGSSVSGRRGGR